MFCIHIVYWLFADLLPLPNHSKYAYLISFYSKCIFCYFIFTIHLSTSLMIDVWLVCSNRTYPYNKYSTLIPYMTNCIEIDVDQIQTHTHTFHQTIDICLITSCFVFFLKRWMFIMHTPQSMWWEMKIGFPSKFAYFKLNNMWYIIFGYYYKISTNVAECWLQIAFDVLIKLERRAKTLPW